MTPEDRRAYRKGRLIALIDGHYSGSQASLAAAADIAPTLVSRYFNGTKGIGEDMVLKIETNTGHAGWFDAKYSEPPSGFNVVPGKRAVADVLHHRRKIVQDLCNIADKISELGVADLIGQAKQLAKTHPLVIRQKRGRAK